MIGQDLVVTAWGARYLGQSFPCAIGRGGITQQKSEGDGATPAGIYPFGKFSVFMRPDRISGGQMPLRRGAIWSDDPDDPRYNTKTLHQKSGLYPFGHEALWRGDRLYDAVVDIGYNSDPVISGAGSAIFIHAWRKPRHPTQGCIAFSPEILQWIIASCRWFDRLVIRA